MSIKALFSLKLSRLGASTEARVKRKRQVFRKRTEEPQVRMTLQERLSAVSLGMTA